MDERVIGKAVKIDLTRAGDANGTVKTEFLPDPDAPSVREVVGFLREARSPLLEGTPDCPELVERLDALIARLEGGET